jgi:SAM-dependent methyltransferase
MPEIEFLKYKIYGNYHWREYEQQTQYGRHADFVKKWVDTPGSILDVGAGDGLITFLLEAKGVDSCETGVQYAQDANVDVILGSVYELPYEENSFDNIYFGDVIEHLEYPNKAMKEIKRVLRNNGWLYLVTPPKQINNILQDEYHFKEYTPDELKSYIESFDFKLDSSIITKNEYVRQYGKFINKKEN